MGLRTKVLLPIGLAGFCLALATAASGSTKPILVLLPSALGLLFLLYAAVEVERGIIRPFLNVRRALGDIAGGSFARSARFDEVGSIEAEIGKVRDLMREKESRLAQEATRSEALRQALHETEERYTLAVRCANDGLWEWNIRSGAMMLSPRWKAMLGFGERELSETVEAWKSVIHPEDLPGVETALRAHLDGATPHFLSEHRVLCKDGSFRWVLSRGAAIRHASGSAYRMIGLDSDISQFKRMEEILMHVANGTAGTTGKEFFRSLVKHFAKVLGVREAFITECVDFPPTRVRTLACWDHDKFIDDEYELAPTPCKKVIEEGVSCFIPKDLTVQFPNELPYGFQSYLGIPIFDSHQKVLGHLVFKDDKEMDDSILLDSIFRIFTARAGGEMERTQEQRVLLEVAQRLPGLSGEERLRSLVKNFAVFLGAKEAFLTECVDQPTTRVRALVYWNAGDVMTNVEYDLAGNPCEDVFGKGVSLYYPKGAAERWPLEKQFNRESYLGLPCLDSAGRVIGHLACFDDKPMRDEPPDGAALQLFAECASAELQQARAASRARTTMNA